MINPTEYNSVVTLIALIEMVEQLLSAILFSTT